MSKALKLLLLAVLTAVAMIAPAPPVSAATPCQICAQTELCIPCCICAGEGGCVAKCQ